MSFTPTPFATPVLAPNVSSAFRSVPYISPSWYRFAPTAVSTLNLVPGSANQIGDSTASLAAVVARASAMMDEYCFWRNDGSFAASVTTETMTAVAKPGGAVVLITNFKPIREVVGVAVGATLSQLVNLGQPVANDILIGDKTITLPAYLGNGLQFPFFAGYPSYGNRVICVYSYVAGWPHFSLRANAAAGASSIDVNPSPPGGTEVYGAYPGSALFIRDGGSTETVVVASVSGLTISLASPLVFGHTVPTSPDSVLVTALPPSLEEACISVTSVLLKMQGMRAQVPQSLGSASPVQKQVLGRAGVLTDWEAAMGALRPYRTVYIH